MKVNGIKYSTPIALAIEKSLIDEEMKFGHVSSIYVDGRSVIFEFIPMITEKFNTHSHSYVLSLPRLSTSCSFFIKQTDLIDYHPYGLYAVSTSQHLVEEQCV